MPLELQHIQKAIQAEGFDGWLFCNFHHRDTIADTILTIPLDLTNSRFWLYGIPAEGTPLKIVHAVEAKILDHLPGSKIVYLSREELISSLGSLGHKRWGVHVSEMLPAVSYLDAGIKAVLERAGLILVSAAGLIQRFKGILDPRGIESHERAAAELYTIIAIAWERVKKAHRDREMLHEGDLRDLMLDELQRRNLITDHPPLVAAGRNSGDPHYDFFGSGAPLQQGDILQFDIWAKQHEAGAIYADISWAGVFGDTPSPRVTRVFKDLLRVREETYRFIETQLQGGRPVSGSMVDARARELLSALGYGSAIKHRTGHGIDTECHGSGVNMDSIEFPDSRLILEGSCFSLEPGIYFSDFGIRTEVNVYILKGNPVVSGKDPQFSLLTCLC